MTKLKVGTRKIHRKGNINDSNIRRKKKSQLRSNERFPKLKLSWDAVFHLLNWQKSKSLITLLVRLWENRYHLLLLGIWTGVTPVEGKSAPSIKITYVYTLWPINYTFGNLSSSSTCTRVKWCLCKVIH